MKPLRSIALAIFPLASLSMLAGCMTGPLGQSTEGRLGKASFSFTKSAGCELGCKTNRPLIPQSEEVLVTHLKPGEEAVEVVSSAPARVKIVRVERLFVCQRGESVKNAGLGQATLLPQNKPNAPCEGEVRTRLRVHIVAKASGAAEIKLLRKDDRTLLDALPLNIETPRSLRIQLTRVQSRANVSRATSVDPLSLESNGARYRIRVLVLTQEGSVIETFPSLKMELPKQQKVIRFSGNNSGSNALQIFPRKNETTLVTGSSGQTLLNIRVHELQRQLALRVIR